MIRVAKIHSLKVDQSATPGLKSRQVLTGFVQRSDEAAVALTDGSSRLAGPGDRPRDRKGGAGWAVPAVPRSLVIFAHDLSAALASLGLAWLLRQNGQAIWADLRLVADDAPLFLALAGASFLAFGLHRRIWSYTSVGELAAIVKASTWAVVLFLAVAWTAGRTTAVPPALWVVQWLILVVLLCGTRLAYRFAKTRVRRARAGAARASTTRDVPVLLYGCGPMAALFVGAVQSAPGSRLRVVGIIEDAGTPRGRYVHNVPVLGEPRDLDRIVADLAVQGIHPQRLVITRPADRLPPELRTFAEHCGARHGMELHVLPEMLGVPADAAASEAARGASAPERAYLRARRPVELGVSALALLLLMPLMGLIALVVLLDQGRPILLRQVHPGRSMRPFTLYKFRTLRGPCYADGALLQERARTSPVGRVLRRSRLDELPQLVNVLRGEMSFIGPRPLAPRDLSERITERIALPPGITGWAEVNGGDRLSIEERIALEMP
jgi:lipopolysaccharide/colanic/teichoic acid biosynthesis glycosyltransferase